MRYELTNIVYGENVVSATLTLVDGDVTLTGEVDVHGNVEEEGENCFVDINIAYDPALGEVLDKHPESKEKLQEELVELLYETIETEKDVIETVTESYLET